MLRLAAAALAAFLIFTASPVHAEPVLNVPAGVTITVTDTGCTAGGFCPYGYGVRSNFYSTHYRTIVVALNQWPSTVMHEWCHAHQHEAVIWYLGREPQLDLADWYQTHEYGAWWYFVKTPTPSAWRLSAPTPLEDWATACGWYFTNPGYLWSVSPERYTAMEYTFGSW